MNKEDLWISRIPLPVRDKISDPVNDTFEDMTVEGPVKEWNIYAPQWAPAAIIHFPDSTNKCLLLQDKDRYDYSRAIRVFKESDRVRIKFRVHAAKLYSGLLEIDVNDRYGNRPFV